MNASCPDTLRIEFMARTIRGIEWVAAAEIQEVLGDSPLAVGHRQVRFEYSGLSHDVLRLGTVDDVFVVVGEFAGIGRKRHHLNALGDQASWCDPESVVSILRSVRTIPARPSFDVTATFLGRRNFNRFEIEDAVGHAVAGATGWRYETRSDGRKAPRTDVSLRVHIEDERATLAARVGAAPAHRRPYRKLSRSASLRPPLARALAMLAGLNPTAVILDPFCGAGTIATEAALANPDVSVIGFDVDPAAVAIAHENAKRAGVAVRFDAGDAAALPLASGTIDRIATNPPWGRTMAGPPPLAATWREMRRVLDANGRIAVLGPQALVDRAIAPLELTPALRQPVSLLGQQAEVAVLSHDGRLVAPDQPFGRAFEEALDRFGGAVG